MKLVDLPQLRALSAREKLQLVDELWDDIARDLESLEVTRQEQEILDERWAAFLHDPSRALTPEQFMKRLKALRA